MEIAAIASPKPLKFAEQIPILKSPRKTVVPRIGHVKYPQLQHHRRRLICPPARAALSSVEKPQQSFYELLGISEDVGLPDIKQAYRQLARKYHPDVCSPEQAEEYTRRFIEVQEAYETLSDPRRKNLYDTHLARGIHSGASGNKRWDYPQEELAKEEWKSRWEVQLSNLKWRNESNGGNQPMSWGARLRQQNHASSN